MPYGNHLSSMLLPNPVPLTIIGKNIRQVSITDVSKHILFTVLSKGQNQLWDSNNYTKLITYITIKIVIEIYIQIICAFANY